MDEGESSQFSRNLGYKLFVCILLNISVHIHSVPNWQLFWKQNKWQLLGSNSMSRVWFANTLEKLTKVITRIF